MQAEVLAGNESFRSALFLSNHLAPTSLFSSLLPLPTPPQEDVTNFKEVSRQNPENSSWEKASCTRASINATLCVPRGSRRHASPLVVRGRFQVLIQFAREGIPKACRGLRLR